LLRHGELDLHRPIIDLRHVVVFDRSQGWGSAAVDQGGSAEVCAELVRVERGGDEGAALSEELLDVLNWDYATVNSSDFYLSLC
jgi:hypothetical protein